MPGPHLGTELPYGISELIPVQPLVWGPPFRSGHPIPVLGPPPSRGAGMGPPLPEWDTPHRYRPQPSSGHSSPVRVLGCDPRSQSERWDRSPAATGSHSVTDTDMGAPSPTGHPSVPGPRPGTDPPTPVQALLQHGHPGSSSPSRYRPARPGTAPVMSPPSRSMLPRRYRTPIPVRDPHPGTGTVMASPSRQGLRSGDRGRCASPSRLQPPLPIPPPSRSGTPAPLPLRSPAARPRGLTRAGQCG